jgi:hypothetical protein
MVPSSLPGCGPSGEFPDRSAHCKDEHGDPSSDVNEGRFASTVSRQRRQMTHAAFRKSGYLSIAIWGHFVAMPTINSHGLFSTRAMIRDVTRKQLRRKCATPYERSRDPHIDGPVDCRDPLVYTRLAETNFRSRGAADGAARRLVYLSLTPGNKVSWMRWS